MIEERKYYVYKHTSPSEKVYIGMTGRKPEKRWKHNGTGYRGQTYFYRAIQKYGWDNFEHEVLFENLTKNEAEHKERELIAYYKSYDSKYGYNIDLGGNYCGNRSEETKRKISEANKGRSYPPIKPETRKLLSEISSGENNPMFGKKHSEKTRKQMSIDRRGQKHEWNRQYVYCVELHKIFNCMTNATNELGVNTSHLCSVCNGSRKTAGGYHWLYVYDKTKKDGTVIQGAITLGYISEKDIEQLAFNDNTKLLDSIIKE